MRREEKIAERGTKEEVGYKRKEDEENLKHFTSFSLLLLFRRYVYRGADRAGEFSDGRQAEADRIANLSRR